MVAELINFEQGCVDNDNSSCTLGVIQKDSREKKEEDVHDEAISIESLPTTNLLRVEAGNNTDAFQHHLKIEKNRFPLFGSVQRMVRLARAAVIMSFPVTRTP